MNIGFRKSLFGFHPGDVLQYLDRTHREFAAAQAEADKKITALQQQRQQLAAQCDDLQRQLDAYGERYEEIERLSKNIGKLYLVAQNSAQAVLQNTAENNSRIQDEVSRHLTAVSETQQALEEVRRQMDQTNSRFCRQVDDLMRQLSTAKENIEACNRDSDAWVNRLADAVQTENE